jgi:hypothetical protein
MVLNQFKLKSYERSLIEPETSPDITTSTELSNELFKDTYVFDFFFCYPLRFFSMLRPLVTFDYGLFVFFFRGIRQYNIDNRCMVSSLPPFTLRLTRPVL